MQKFTAVGRTTWMHVGGPEH